jgi:flagellin
MGAVMNQLSYSADNLTNISTNIAASRSNILDTDYATASSQLSKSQIIQQAATAMLAQANQQPQSVLALLK